MGYSGSLTTLAFDGGGLGYIIGGGAGTIIRCGQPGQPPCPIQVPEPSSPLLVAVAGLGLVAQLRRRQSKSLKAGH